MSKNYNTNEQTKTSQQNNQTQIIDYIPRRISHELLNPLTNIKLNLSIMKEKSSKNKEVESALEALDYLVELIDYYKNLDNKRKIYFSIKSHIDKVVTIIENKLNRNNIKVQINIDPSIKIFGIPTSFRQILLNLITNSIEAYQDISSYKLQTKSRIIEISAKITENKVIIYFSDFAMGISEYHSELIFEAFCTTKANNGNLGLGLNICKNILARDFNGTINLVSNKNPTKFEIIIPTHGQ